MALLDNVKAVCDELAPHGWGDLLKAHGLDIGVPVSGLAAELARPLDVNRTLAGFDDSVITGGKAKGIEPGKPAFSLLYHALASPNVLKDPSGLKLRGR